MLIIGREHGTLDEADGLRIVYESKQTLPVESGARLSVSDLGYQC